MVKEKRIQAIQTTEHAMELLLIASRGDQNLSLKALSQKLKISREEVLILLVAMENRGLVSWDNLKKSYGPGGAALEVAHCLVRKSGRASASIVTPSPPS